MRRKWRKNIPDGICSPIPTSCPAPSWSILQQLLFPDLATQSLSPKIIFSLLEISGGIVTELSGELLTEILVKMESRSDKAERYMRILSPPNLRWRYSGIVTICQSEKRVTAALARAPPGMVPGQA